jgi:hypothetical protein
MINEVHVCARVVMAATAGPQIKLGARNFDNTFRAIISCAIPNTPNPCYTTFCFNAPYQFTPLFYLRPFFFGFNTLLAGLFAFVFFLRGYII